MDTAVGKVLEWAFGKNKRERDGAIFYLKSLLFLILIVILVSDRFWDMSSSIKKMLNIDVVYYILYISNIGIHFFTSLAIISFVVSIMSAIICEVAKRITCFKKYEDHFGRMRIGAEFRLLHSVEDVLLFLIIAYIFDKNVLQNFIFIYPKFILIVLGILCVFQFLTSRLVGILNLFFMLKRNDEMDE